MTETRRGYQWLSMCVFRNFNPSDVSYSINESWYSHIDHVTLGRSYLCEILCHVFLFQKQKNLNKKKTAHFKRRKLFLHWFVYTYIYTYIYYFYSCMYKYVYVYIYVEIYIYVCRCDILHKIVWCLTQIFVWYLSVRKKKKYNKRKNSAFLKRWKLICVISYGVATINRLLKIIGLLRKRDLSKRRYSAK